MIERAYWKANLEQKNPALGHLENAARIHLPLPGTSVPLSTAATAYEIAATAILTYLLSLTLAIRQQRQTSRDAGGVDWIFLHPSWIGPTLARPIHEST